MGLETTPIFHNHIPSAWHQACPGSDPMLNRSVLNQCVNEQMDGKEARNRLKARNGPELFLGTLLACRCPLLLGGLWLVRDSFTKGKEARSGAETQTLSLSPCSFPPLSFTDLNNISIICIVVFIFPLPSKLHKSRDYLSSVPHFILSLHCHAWRSYT